MKPLNLLTVILFLAGLTWALTRSERGVQTIQHGYYSVISPFLKKGTELEKKVRTFNDHIKLNKELESELEAVKTKNTKLKLEVAQLRKLKAENSELSKALGFKSSNNFSDIIAAKIIRRNPSFWWETALINRGINDNIKAQMPVIAAQGLVGKVDQSNDKSATVILLTDEACQVSAIAEGSNEVGILSGQRAQTIEQPVLRLKYLPNNTAVQPGQKVYTTGRGSLFPKGLLLGTVVSIEHGSLNAEALVQPAVDFATLQTVFVLNNQP